MSVTQKIRNWSEYNKSLKKRGAILFTFDADYVSSLYYQGKQKKGGIRCYTDKMYEYLLNIKVLLRLPWRATIGFAEGMLKKAFPHEDITIPDYTHASRAVRALKLSVRHPVLSESIELALDSTGVNVYTTSGWHQRKYGKDSLCRRREQWKKIHLAMDLNSMQIVSVSYTDSNRNDCQEINRLCDGLSGKIKNVRADGAYDTEAFYKKIMDWGAQAIIPPACTSKAQDELSNPPKEKKPHLVQRDAIIHTIRAFPTFKEGLKQWKINSDYHQRSRVEACMFRLKRIFGFYLHHRNKKSRLNEIIAKINLLNVMTSLGKAEYETIVSS